MSNDTAPDFDLGPLTWVQGEIDQALTRGLDALAAYKGSPDDVASLKQAKAHVHQAAGAIQMVGLDAVTAYTDEIERQLARVEELPAEEAQIVCDHIDRACRKLKIFLDELVGGASPVPLKLFPEYELMQQSRGVKASAPTDLFFPDLSPRAPKIAVPKSITAQKLPSFLLKQRRLYQRALLAWLRGDEEATAAMRDAIQGIEDVQTQSSQRSFWWTVGALLESIVEKGVESGFGVKQLCGRVDLQIRRIVEGSGKVADRMRREVLYYVAISAPVGPQVQAVQRAYGLHGLIPTAEVLSADVVRTQPLLRETRDLLATIKDLWLKLTGGRPENLPKLKQALSHLRDKTAAIGEPSLSKLAGTLAARVDKIGVANVPDVMAMEYATALLLAESAVDNFNAMSPEFPKQVDAMIARLDAAQQNKSTADIATIPLLDEMARRAQERLLLAQVAREIQTNLRHMEQVLDAFFRDHAKRGDLATLAHDSRQIAGALKMLGLDSAEQLLALCQVQIDRYAQPDSAVADSDLESLAESLSALGFYIEAVEQQRPGRERLIDPILAQRLGARPVDVAPVVETVETDVADVKASLPAMLEEFQRSEGDAPARDRLAAELTLLQEDAELIGDTRLRDEAGVALEQLARADGGTTAALEHAIGVITDEGAAEPAPAPSAETIRLLETDATQFDAELLEIFLTEADEVLDFIAESSAQLKARNDDRDALATARRGFHTLKGSGRMVGLTDLGDLAHDVEKLHNRVIDEDRPLPRGMIALIDTAQREFRGWVDALKHTRKVSLDTTALRRAIASVETELEPADPLGALPPPDLAPAGAEPSPVTPSVPLIDVIEVDDAHAGGLDDDLRPDADGDDLPLYGSADVIEFSAASPAFADVSDQDSAALSAALVDSDEITVGDVTLSSALYRILCDEAQQHLATLDTELQLLQFDPATTPSQSMIRASHTLCGIHRTGNFPLVATTAKSLETCLLSLQERGPPMPDGSHPVIARAITGLHVLAGRVRMREGFGVGDAAEAAEIIAELDELRQRAAPQPVGDCETIAARVADAEEFVGPVDALFDSPPVADDVAADESLPTIDMVPDGPAAQQEHEEAHEVEQTDIGAEPSDAPAVSLAQLDVPVAASFDEGASITHDVDDVQAETIPAIDAPQASEDIDTGMAEIPPPTRAIDPPTPDVAPPVDAGLDASAPDLGAQDATSTAFSDPHDPHDPHADAISPRVPLRLIDPPANLIDVGISVIEPAANEGDADAASTAVVASVSAPAPATPIFEAPAIVPIALAQEILSEASIANVHDDVDPQVLPIFLEEAAELFPQAGEQVRAWRRNPASTDPAYALQRTLHTFKGSARMAGAMRLGELAHWMESRLPEGAALSNPSADLFDALESDLDHLAFVLDKLQKSEFNTPLPWLAGENEAVAIEDMDAEAPAVPAMVVALPLASAQTATAAPATTTFPEPEAARAMLRVRADLIDRLVNEAGEVAITRARVEGELRSLKGNLLELTNSVIRLRAQVREIEIQGESQIQSRMSVVDEGAEGFDPLEFDRYTRFQELTRSLAEGVNDVSTVQQSLLKNLDEADAALLAQARLSRDVQQQLFSIRTVPFGSLSERLYRIMRQTAKELDKRANLEIRGTQVELDRSVLEKLVGPLEHLLRNALDHGLETRDERQRTGKPETGEITLNVNQQGNEIAIRLADDGKGLDLDRIRAKARAQLLVPADVEPTDAQLIECIFAPGFSTASNVTQISGRGVGMDVVRSDIATLGGRVEVGSVPGKGTSFTLYLPLTLAVAQTVLVRAGGRMWALPSPMVEQVQQIKDRDLINLYLTREVSWQSRKYPFFYLPRLLGSAGHNPETTRYNSVLLLKSGTNLAAVHIDEMIGNQEVVVKNIGPQLARVSGIAGATVLGTGEVVLIINAVQLAQRLDTAAEAPMIVKTPQAAAAAAAAAAARAGPPLVMIVDDSLTVRKITSRLLTREGFQVMTAKDGLDALQLLSERIPDVILLDIEMPRMDGFEFAKNAKSDANYADIPIVMITSRTAEKHRNRARELGVQRYLGKPYQEEELLRTLHALVGMPAA